MDLNIIKKNSLIEKDEAFMPIAFVDLSIPAAAIALNGKAIGHEINKEFKKTVYPGREFQPQPVMNLTPATTSPEVLQQLRSSIDDIM